MASQSAHEGGKFVSTMDRPPLPPGDLWYSFLLEAEATQSHSAAGRIKSMRNPNDPHRESNPLSSGL